MSGCESRSYLVVFGMTAAPGLGAAEVEGFAAVDANGLLVAAEDTKWQKVNDIKTFGVNILEDFHSSRSPLEGTHQGFWVWRHRRPLAPSSSWPYRWPVLVWYRWPLRWSRR